MSTLIIDEGYEGLVYGPLAYTLEGHQKFLGDVHVKVPLLVDGDLTVKGNLKCDWSLCVHGNEFVEGTEYIRGNQTIRGTQTIGEKQHIKGNQIIRGHQLVMATQFVTGDQTVHGRQKIDGAKFIGGIPEIGKGMRILGEHTDFAPEMVIQGQNIIFMSHLIYINGECHSPDLWKSFAGVRNMPALNDKHGLEWWDVWGKFVLDTHAALIAGHKHRKVK